MFEDQTALPAQIIIAATEDLRVDFAFQDGAGAAINITVPGFGDWELVLAPNSGSAAAITFPGSGLTLANDPLKATNTLSLAATLATISPLMPVDTVFEGDLVRVVAGVRQAWARVGFMRGAAPQSIDQLGNHIVTISRNATGVIAIQLGGSKGADGAYSAADPIVTSLADGDFIPVQVGGVSKRITLANMRAAILA